MLLAIYLCSVTIFIFHIFTIVIHINMGTSIQTINVELPSHYTSLGPGILG